MYLIFPNHGSGRLNAGKITKVGFFGWGGFVTFAMVSTFEGFANYVLDLYYQGLGDKSPEFLFENYLIIVGVVFRL